MIYELLFPLRHDAAWLRWLNVLRYVPFRVIAATDRPRCCSPSSCRPGSSARCSASRSARSSATTGPATHKIKSGTPTMGGALILLCVLVPTILWCDPHNVFVWATAAVTAGYGVIGYLDDYLKIKLKNSRGVPGRYKLLGQFVIARRRARATRSSRRSTSRPTGGTSATRLGRPVRRVRRSTRSRSRSAVYLAVRRARRRLDLERREPHRRPRRPRDRPRHHQRRHVPHLGLPRRRHVRHRQRLAAVRRRALPRHPVRSRASASSRSTAAPWSAPGSASFGTTPTRRRSSWGTSARSRSAAASGCAPSSPRTSSCRVILGGVFFVEAVSVVVQVASFKLTGKRIFLMAPIHHHYEKKGWPEPKIIVRFWIISVLLALVGLSSLKLR